MKYELTRKQVDELIIDWEKLHQQNKQTESLPMFIMHKQAENGREFLRSKGVIMDGKPDNH